MAYFPMFVDLTQQPCLVVGGGNVAYRKVLVLLDFGARVSVVSEDFCDELIELAGEQNKESGKPLLFKKSFEETDLDGYTVVIAATDDKGLNRQISIYCRANKIMVNAVDQKEDCSFIFPSYVKEQNLVAAFSSGGNSPALTQYLKAKEKDILTPALGRLGEYMGSIRDEVMEKYPSEEERRRVFQAIIDMALERGL